MRYEIRRVALAIAVTAIGRVAAAQPATQPAAQPASQPTALSLEDAIRIAERESEAVRIAQAGVQRARGQRLQAQSQYFPQLSGTANYTKTLQSQFDAISKQSAPAPDTSTGPKLSSVCAPNIPANASDAQRNAALALAQSCSSSGADLSGFSRIFASPYSLTLGVSGSQTLFSGGRVGAANAVAKAAGRSAEIGVTAARAQLQLDVAQAYYGAVLADRLVTISESTYVQAERTLRQTSLANQVGNVAEFDLLRARVTRDNQRPVLIQARAQRDISYLQLRQMLNLPAGQPLALTTQLPMPASPAPTPQRSAQAPTDATRTLTPASRTETSLAFDPAEVLADDPRVATTVDSVLAAADTAARDRAPARQARENVTVQRNLLKQARAQRLPQVALSTAYQRFSYPSGGAVPLPSSWNQFFPNWTASIGVSMPLFTGGRIRGDELVAQAGLREAEQTARQVEEFSALDAQTAIATLAQAEAAWLASAGTAEQATRAYGISEVRFREGISTLVELSDARLMLQQAQWNAVTAARDVQIARLKLALLKDLPLSTQGAASASRSSATGSAAGSAAGSAGSGAAQGASSTTQQSAQSAGGFQQAGTAGRSIP